MFELRLIKGLFAGRQKGKRESTGSYEPFQHARYCDDNYSSSLHWKQKVFLPHKFCNRRMKAKFIFSFSFATPTVPQRKKSEFGYKKTNGKVKHFSFHLPSFAFLYLRWNPMPFIHAKFFLLCQHQGITFDFDFGAYAKISIQSVEAFYWILRNLFSLNVSKYFDLKFQSKKK